MSHNGHLQKIDALILCGGQGTRLRAIASDTPKVLMQIGEKTFLDVLIENFFAAGFSRLILSVGYLKEQIVLRYGKTPNIFFAEEHSPLGTGGAVKNAENLIESNDVLVANGDSIFTGLDLEKFYEFHKRQNGLISIALASPRAEKDFGAVVLAENGQILDFAEKTDPGAKGLMNGGVYFMQKSVLGLMSEGPFSLEYDFFPRFTRESLYGFFSSGEVIDIGTPERYEYAKTILA